MESAGDGGSTWAQSNSSASGLSLPQWSPPVNGGSTVYQQIVFVDANHPQWSRQ